jgi:drug/metabolite transporter (DMT)-like permease
MPPLVMAGMRFLVAGAILYAITLRPGQPRNGHTDLRHWRSALVIGGLLLAGGNGGVSWSEQFIASGLAALLVATVPLWMALIAHLTGDERLNWMMAGGIVLGLIGVAILVHPAGGASHLWGVLAVLLAAVAWAAGSIYARRAPLPAHPLLATAMEMLAGGVVLLLLATLDGEWTRVHLARVSMASALALGYLIAFGSLLAFSCYVWLLTATRASLVSTYAYVNPVVAVALGAVVLHEVISLRTLIAGGVIVLAVAFIVSARSFPPRVLAAWLRQAPGRRQGEAA